jgi:hypothetical protein
MYLAPVVGMAHACPRRVEKVYRKMVDTEISYGSKRGNLEGRRLSEILGS